MAIPDFTPDGVLPPGMHDCSIEELGTRFGAFDRSDRRQRLFEKLVQFLAEARQSRLVTAVVINGSFVTRTPEPNDVDLILLLNKEHDFSADLRPFEYNVVSRRQARQRYGIDVLVAEEGSTSAADYAEFFSRVRGGSGRRKGLLRVVFD